MDWTAEYFTLGELVRSGTADRLGIDNTPSAEAVCNLNRLATGLLDPLRRSWGGGIRVTSGYRCRMLNTAVGGVETSSHMAGLAADLVPADGRIREFLRQSERFFKDCPVPFDQAIIERNNKGTEWLHVSLAHIDGRQRRQVFNLQS